MERSEGWESSESLECDNGAGVEEKGCGGGAGGAKAGEKEEEVKIQGEEERHGAGVESWRREKGRDRRGKRGGKMDVRTENEGREMRGQGEGDSQRDERKRDIK